MYLVIKSYLFQNHLLFHQAHLVVQDPNLAHLDTHPALILTIQNLQGLANLIIHPDLARNQDIQHHLVRY